MPSVTVQGAFSDGSSNSQIVQDHENDFELQNYFSGAFGPHSLNFGARVRSYDDVNYSTSGSNGSYNFGSLNDYLGCVQPSQGTCKPRSTATTTCRIRWLAPSSSTPASSIRTTGKSALV